MEGMIENLNSKKLMTLFALTYWDSPNDLEGSYKLVRCVGRDRE